MGIPFKKRFMENLQRDLKRSRTGKKQFGGRMYGLLPYNQTSDRKVAYARAKDYRDEGLRARVEVVEGYSGKRYQVWVAISK